MFTHVLINKKGDNQTFAADDRIFLGEGLFETLKVKQTKPCYADLHWQRLKNAAQKLGMPFDLSYEHWLECLEDKINQDEICTGGIKAILSGGRAPRGLTEYGHHNGLLLQTFQFNPQSGPLRLACASWVRDPANPVYQVKSINYLEAIAARRQALAAGVDDVLFFNTHHHATETTCANLFIVSRQCLLTPPLSDGVLAGITRSRILTLCQQHQIDYQEISLTRSMIAEAEAAFISSSLQGIQEIISLDKLTFGLQNPLTMFLNSLVNQ